MKHEYLPFLEAQLASAQARVIKVQADLDVEDKEDNEYNESGESKEDGEGKEDNEDKESKEAVVVK